MPEEPLLPLIQTPPGRYRHYKGNLYDVIGVVQKIGVRFQFRLSCIGLAAMFSEDVVIDGVTQPRFTRV